MRKHPYFWSIVVGFIIAIFIWPVVASTGDGMLARSQANISEDAVDCPWIVGCVFYTLVRAAVELVHASFWFVVSWIQVIALHTFWRPVIFLVLGFAIGGILCLIVRLLRPWYFRTMY